MGYAKTNYCSFPGGQNRMPGDIVPIHDKEITVKLQYHLGSIPGFNIV